jgi:hypothetical protein
MMMHGLANPKFPPISLTQFLTATRLAYSGMIRAYSFPSLADRVLVITNQGNYAY